MNTKIQTEAKPPSRIYKAFIKTCPEYTNVEYVDNGFKDEMVQCFYVMFSAGYKAHPSFNHGGVHFIAKETETGLEISSVPVFHINYPRAVSEKQRLEGSYGARFHIFSALASSDDLRNKLKNEFANRNKKRKLVKETVIAQIHPPTEELNDA